MSRLVTSLHPRPVIPTELRQAVVSVWQAIGPDCYANAEATGEPISNGGAVESCVDGGRLAPEAGFIDSPIPHSQYKALVARYGYGDVFAAICAEVHIA